MSRAPIRIVRIAVAAAAIIAFVVAAPPPPVAGWANAGDGYATHDWIVDRALDILDVTGRRPAWFDRDLALRYTDDPDTIERIADPSRGWEHVYYDTSLTGGAIQRISEHFTAALDALEAGDTAAATINVGFLSHFLVDISQPYHTARAGYGKSELHVSYESAVGARTRTPDGAPEWASPTRAVWAIGNIRRSMVATAGYSRIRYADLDRAWAATRSIDDPTVTRITGEVLKRAARDLANVIWSLDRGTGRSPDVTSVTAGVRWVGVRNGDPGQAVFADVSDAVGSGIAGAEIRVSWPLPDGTRKLYRSWTDATGHMTRTIGVGTLPMLRRQDVPVVAIVNGATVQRTPWFIPSPKLADGRAGFTSTVNDPTPDVGQTIRVTSLARDTMGRPVPGLLVTWTWDLGTGTVRTSAVTNASGKAFSYRLVTSSLTSGTVSIRAHVQSYSLDRYSSTSFNRN